MLNHPDGAKHPETVRFDANQSAAEFASGERETATFFGGPSWPTTHMADPRHTAIALKAYRLAERRHFEPGHEMQDWLEAEASIEFAGSEAT